MWRLVEDIAQLELPTLSARIEMKRPSIGLAQVAIGGTRFPNTRLLGASLVASSSPGKAEFEDTYVRRNDLIASYSTCDSRSINMQINWHALTDPSTNAVGVEAIVSVETDLPDANPAATIGSRITADEILRLNSISEQFQPLQIAGGLSMKDAALLFRLPEVPCSYLEMIHPADLEEVHLSRDSTDDSTIESRFQLFCEPLEKGVIRRGRIRGLILPRENDIANAARCYQAFVESEIPLGT